MSTVMYRRVSTVGQNLDRQEVAGDVDKVFEDKLSGKDRERPELARCLAYLREGDTLRCHSTDRLARSLNDLVCLVNELTGRGVRVQFTKEGLDFDPGSEDPYKTFQLQLLGALGELERKLIAVRRDEGIAIAKARGVYAGKGRPPALKPQEVRTARERRAMGVPLARLVRDLGVAKSTLVDALGGVGPYAAPEYA